MADTRDDYDWIEAWLDDSLSPEERRQFQARLQSDPALRQEVREQQEAIVAYRLLEKEQARERLQQQWEAVKAKQQINFSDEASPEEHGTGGKVVNFRRWGFWLAAAAAVAVIMVLVLRPAPEPQTPSQLAMAYFDPDPPGLTKGAAETDSLFQLAAAAYQAERYAAAADYFARILEDGANERARYYLGLSQMAQQQWPEAAANLAALANSEIYAEPVRWNRALLYLHQNQIDLARELLNQIVRAERHYKKTAALALLDQLEKTD